MKKFVMIIVVALFFSFIGANMVFATADTWTQKASLGGSVRAYAVSFSIENKGYIGGGYYIANLQDFWEYNPSTDAWTQKANLLTPVGSTSPSFSIGSKGYAGYMGIINGNVFIQSFAEYDPSTNTWTKKADFPSTNTIYFRNAAGFSIGSKGYLGPGQGPGQPNGEINSFWEYDPSTDTWTEKADFAGERRYMAVGFSIGNKGYIGGGITVEYDGNGDDYDTSTNAYKDFWEYNPTTDAWTRKADIGGSGRCQITGFSIGSNGYIYGGQGWGSMVTNNDFWEYIPATDTWTKKADFAGVARILSTGFAIGTKGYVGTGASYDSSWTFLNDLWEYDTGN